mgnify:CR=1 FL=1
MSGSRGDREMDKHAQDDAWLARPSTIRLLWWVFGAVLALSVAARGYVMESGTIALSDSGPALLANPKVREAYLGE